MRLGNYEFTDPWPLNIWTPPDFPGIYAILARDPTSPENRYRLIYIGESENLAERGFPSSHHRYNCWVREAGHDLNLYVSWMMSTEYQDLRRLTEQELIRQYDPVCNRTGW